MARPLFRCGSRVRLPTTLFYAAEVPHEADQIAAVPRTGECVPGPTRVTRTLTRSLAIDTAHRTLRGPAQGPYPRTCIVFLNSGRRPDSR